MKTIVHKIVIVFVACASICTGLYAVGESTSKGVRANQEKLRRAYSLLEEMQNDLNSKERKKNSPGIIRTFTDSSSVPLEIEKKLKDEFKLISDSLINSGSLTLIRHLPKPLDILESIDRINSLDTCVKAFDKFARKVNTTNNENEQTVTVLSLKYAVRAGFVSYKERLNDLQEIQKLHRYWIEQKLHKRRYFLHKSPHKWFFGKRQESEIDDNIRYLEHLQETYYEHLGALVSHLYQFETHVMKNDQGVLEINSKKQYTWISELLHRIDSLWGLHPNKKQAITSTKELVDVVQKQLSRVKDNRKTLYDLINDVKKPNHFARNWLWYTGLTVAGIAAYKFYRNDPKGVENWFGERKNNLIGFIKDYFYERPRSLTDQIFKNRDYDERAEKAENLARRFEEISKDSRLNVENHRDRFAQELKNFGMSHEDINSVLNNKDLQSLTKHWDTKWRSDINGQVKGIKLVIGGAVYEFDQIKEIIGELGELSCDTVSDVLKFNSDNDLMKKIIALTPTLLIGWAGAKGLRELYNKVTNRNFYQLSRCLKDIAVLLEEDERAFTHRKYGKLLFLTHQLKHEIIRLVPKKNNMQQEMLNDTVRIESRQSSIDEKIATIVSMKDHYFPFLYKGVAA